MFNLKGEVIKIIELFIQKEYVVATNVDTHILEMGGCMDCSNSCAENCAVKCKQKTVK